MSEAGNNKDNFSLPTGFTAIEYADGGDYTRKLLDDLREDDVEVWLIKAPLGADIKSLDGQKLKLDRRSLCKCESDKSRKYEITHHSSVPNELESSMLLVPDFDHGELKPCSAKICGYLSISETVTLPETQFPAVVDSKVPFPENLRLRYVPFGADNPIVPSSPKLKKRKHIETSEDERPQKKKSKQKTKHKESSLEKSTRNSADDSKEEVMLPISNKNKPKTSSEDQCEKVKSAKITNMDKYRDSSSAEDYKSVVKVKKEKLSPVKTQKTKKSKKKESFNEDSFPEGKESHSFKKKSKGNKHSDKNVSANAKIENNLASGYNGNGDMHIDSDTD